MKKPKSVLSGEGIASIARNSSYMIGSRVLNIAVRSVYAIVLAHYLGPELYGFLNYGTSWYLSFLFLTGLGTIAILVVEIGKDRNKGAEIASLTLTLRGSATVLAAILCAALGWYIEGKSDVRILLIVFSFALIGRSLAMWSESVFVAYEVNKYTFYIQTIFRITEVILGIVILLVGGKALAVAIVHTLSWWLQALCGMVLCQRRLISIRLNWSWNKMKNILIKSLPIGMGFALTNWLLSGPIVLFRHTGDAENSLGQFALAMQMFAILGGIPLSIGLSSLPLLSRSVTRQDGKDILFTETMMKAAFIFGGSIGIAGLGIGPWIVDTVFGPSYRETGGLLGLTMWLIIPWTCGSVIWKVLLAKGKIIIPLLCSGAGALILTLTMPLFVSVWNTSGAVFATGIGMGVWALSSIWILVKSDDLDVIRTVFRPLAVVLFSLGVFFVLRSIHVWIALLSGWTALLCGTLLFGVLTKNERAILVYLKGLLSSS